MDCAIGKKYYIDKKSKQKSKKKKTNFDSPWIIINSWINSK